MSSSSRSPDSFETIYRGWRIVWTPIHAERRLFELPAPIMPASEHLVSGQQSGDWRARLARA